MKRQWMLVLLLPLIFLGCAQGNCRKHQQAAAATPVIDAATGEAAKVKAPAPTAEAQITPKPNDRVRVFKYDGSLQCNMGKALAAGDMQKDLKNITVYGSENKSDGLMRIQQCGTPTGRANVYEIDRKDLDAAKKLGFQLWTFD